MTWGVIFDMDGVLVDSSEAHYEAWRELGDQVGKPFSRQLFESTFGMHNQQIMPLWLGEVSQERLQELADQKEAAYRRLAPSKLKAIAGVQELIARLRAERIPLAVGSSGPLANVRLILESLGLSESFQALSTGEDVHHGKPDPEVFLVAARRLGLEPRQCVVMEDAPQGIEAARRAQMPVVAITSSRPANQLPADLVVDDFHNLQPQQLASLLASLHLGRRNHVEKSTLGPCP
jgi:beta-phosphoglucomutase